MQDLIEELLLFVAKKSFFFALGLTLMIVAFFNSSLIVGCIMFGIGLISVLYAVSDGDISCISRWIEYCSDPVGIGYTFITIYYSFCW